MMAMTTKSSVSVNAEFLFRGLSLMVRAVRGGAGDRGSSGAGRRRWCRRKETATTAIPHGRRKRPRWLCLGGGHEHAWCFRKDYIQPNGTPRTKSDYRSHVQKTDRLQLDSILRRMHPQWQTFHSD